MTIAADIYLIRAIAYGLFKEDFNYAEKIFELSTCCVCVGYARLRARLWEGKDGDSEGR